jgi:class 3 adenylate cyclase
MGVHTGVAHERDNDYFGPTLNRTARLRSAAHGGQTVISAATHELITDARLLDMGEHRLKDLSRPERVWQLIIEGLTRDFPPLRTLNAVPTRPARRVRHPGPRVRPGRPLHARRRHQPWAVAIAATFRAIIETYTGHSDLARQASARAVAAAPRDLAPSFAALVGFMAAVHSDAPRTDVVAQMERVVAQASLVRSSSLQAIFSQYLSSVRAEVGDLARPMRDAADNLQAMRATRNLGLAGGTVRRAAVLLIKAAENDAAATLLGWSTAVTPSRPPTTSPPRWRSSSRGCATRSATPRTSPRAPPDLACPRRRPWNWGSSRSAAPPRRSTSAPQTRAVQPRPETAGGRSRRVRPS